MRFAKSNNPANRRTYVLWRTHTGADLRIAVINNDLPLKAIKAQFGVDLDRIHRQTFGRSLAEKQAAIVAAIPNAAII